MKRTYIRNVKFLDWITISGHKFVAGEVVNPRHHNLSPELLEHLEEKGVVEVRRYNKQIPRPIFTITEVGFMGPGGPNPHNSKYEGKRSVFGHVKRFYVHGELEAKVGFDIAQLISGDFLDLPEQKATLVDLDNNQYDAVIVMVTATDTGGKYAFLVSDQEGEIRKARACLLNGEWLQDGKSRF